MASRPAQACAQLGCHGVVIDGSCSICGPRRRANLYDDRRGSAASRGYGREWQRLRLMVLRREPLCRTCAEQGIVTPATDVDHIIPKRDGGPDSFENLQPLCHSHHSQKTATEKSDGTDGQRAVVTVVAGPPGAGKTTYVNERKRWGDLVVDVDAIYAALSGLDWYEKPAPLLPFVLAARDAIIARLRQANDVQRAWVITSEGERSKLTALASSLDAELIVLDVDASECNRRIANDDRRKRNHQHWQSIVERWWSNWSNGDGRG